MKTGARAISHTRQFDDFFKRTKGRFITVKENAGVDDTIKLMRDVIQSQYSDTIEIAKYLKGENDFESCRNIWNFCFKHIQYKRDDEGFEQVRRPYRVWQDRLKGVDCDCLTVFICSLMKALNINFLIRLTSYPKQKKELETDEFEHVYPVALINNTEVIMDCVVHQFNYEVSYKTKMDVTMKLQYLDGFATDGFSGEPSADQLNDFLGNAFSTDDLGIIFSSFDEIPEIELEGLEGKAQREEKRAIRKATPMKERIHNTLHTVNRVNPATTLLRAGVLASMKLNVLNVAGKLRFAYWSKDLALKNNMEAIKYDELVAIRVKLEKIFFGAGGKPENLREAILTGRGNKNKRVTLSGVGELAEVSDWQDLQGMIGSSIYSDEFSEFSSGSVNGLGSLGSITAASAIASASGVMATIAGLLKKIGNLFHQGTPQNAEEIQQETSEEAIQKTGKYSPEKMVDLVKKIDLINPPITKLPPNKITQIPGTAPDESLILAKETQNSDDSLFTNPENATAEKSEIKSGDTKDENKLVKWVKDNPYLSAGIALLALGGVFLVVKAVKGKKKTSSINGLEGAPKGKKKTKKSRKKTPSYIGKVGLK